MITVQELFLKGKSLLKDVSDPSFESKVLLLHSIGISEESFYSHPEREVSDTAGSRFLQLASRRQEGFPLAYEVLPGNTADCTTLPEFLRKIEKAQRIWVMDRGIPTEESLAQMRQAVPPIHYLVGTLASRREMRGPRLQAKAGSRERPDTRSRCCPRAEKARR